MFTGIVQQKCQVIQAVQQNGVMRLSIATTANEGLALGASIAINGTCLTVVAWDDSSVNFDVIDETLAITNLGEITTGDWVNVERAARFGDEIGGHLVSGHVHCQASLLEIKEHDDNLAMHLSLDAKWRDYVFYKGFVTVDGASLTVGELTEQGFWLHLIPETLRITTMGQREIGYRFNIEIDSQTQITVDTMRKLALDGRLAKWMGQ